jgi:hypothetical protein
MKRGSLLLVTVLAVSVSAYGQIIDPLHGCIIGTNCADNGTVTPTTTNPLPKFTFTVSPGPNTGDFLVEILVPDDATGASTESFSISGTNAGATDSSNIGPVTSTKIGLWTSGGLDAFLHLTASPANPLDAWLSYTQGNNCGATQKAACDPNANGYYVYQVDLGTNELQGPSNPTVPILTLSGSSLPIASLLAGFLGQSDGTYIATAPSGGIFEAGGTGGTTGSTGATGATAGSTGGTTGSTGTTGSSVPEPVSIMLLGTVLFVTFGLASRKKSIRS